MHAGTSHISVEGWRIRRRQPAGRRRPLRAAVVGDGSLALRTARLLAQRKLARVLLSVETSAAARTCGLELGGLVLPVVQLEKAAPADVVIVCEPAVTPREPLAARVRDVALWAARTCPSTALILACENALWLCREAATASGLPPWLILSPGGMTLAAAEAARLARLVGAGAGQIDVPVIGGDRPAELTPLRRYATLAGIPVGDLIGERGDVRRGSAPAAPGEEALVLAVVALAGAVLKDSLSVLSCGAWVEGGSGMHRGFVVAPVRVGCRGAEEPLALRLTLEERSLLNRAAVGL